MSNLLRRTLFPTEEELAEDRKKFMEIWKQGVEERCCSVCVHFYDYSTGLSTNFGCDLGDEYDDIAILRIGRGNCDKWEEVDLTSSQK